MSQNYPDPFRGKTAIKFCVAYKSRVRLDVCDCENKIIIRLLDEQKEAGTYEIEFEACELSPGSYFCILQVGEFVATRRMTLKEPRDPN